MSEKPSKREIKRRKGKARYYRRLMMSAEDEYNCGVALIRQIHPDYSSWETKYDEHMKWLKIYDKEINNG